ncbi:hypothetical protein L9F63_002269 [Diploptera punctata]|uniref:Crossover junction endonuclease MUS81 n=1 Tax=Diploptera punctata TaxID=6984 RepID=A0AAD8A2J0_DIPPU|nr:hypothetical protein L9F63_002269 [Diploptera punctata]
MSSLDPKKKRIRISVKPRKSPNPLFEKWLEEWKKEAESKGSDLQYCFGKALKSLQKYPLPLKTGRDCGILGYFGNRLCVMLDRKLAEYKKEHPEGLDAECDDIADDNPQQSSTKNIANKAKPRSKKLKSPSKDDSNKKGTRKRTKEYVPAWRSGPYALLLALLDAEQKPGYQGHLTKAELQTMAQPLCDTSFKRPDPGTHYTAWNSMSGLVRRGLVLKHGCPAKFSLSDTGSELAKKLRDECNSKNKSTDSIEISDESDENCGTASSSHKNSASSSDNTNFTSSEKTNSLTDYSSETITTKTSMKQLNSYQNNLHHKIQLQDNKMSPQKKQCKSQPSQFSSGDDTVILMPGTFDVILLVEKRNFGNMEKLQDDQAVRELSTTGILFELRHLKVGDYVWVCRDRNAGHELMLPYVVERKRMDDLAKSIQDGRYRDQKFRMKRSGIQNVIYLIESHGDNTHTILPLQSLKQAAVNTQVIDKITVKRTSSLRDSVRYLGIMTKLLVRMYSKKTIVSCQRENLPQIQIGDDLISLMTFKEFNSNTGKNKVLDTQSLFMRQLMQLSGLSFPKAKAIVKCYPSVRVLMAAYQEAGSAGEKLLAGIRYGSMNRTIGPVISKTIYQLYSHYNLS